jgi:hypothetical protein
MSYGQGQRQAKMPDPGRGRLREIAADKVKTRPDGSRLSPNFFGYVNVDGVIKSMSIWYMPANGQMPACFDVRISDPQQNQQPQAYQQPQQAYQQPAQGGHYHPQQGHGGYAPQQPPPQGGWQAPPQGAPTQPPQAPSQGYTPAPGYTPPPNPAGPPPAWGGQTGQTAQAQHHQPPMGQVINDKLPF